MANSDISRLVVLLVEPGKTAKMSAIDGSLSGLQIAVGGDIEAAYFFDDPVAIICQEEGMLNGSPLNRAIRDEDGHIIDIIAGKFIVCGLSKDNLTSLPVSMQQKYMDMFKQPETFRQINNRITVVTEGNEKPNGRQKNETR